MTDTRLKVIVVGAGIAGLSVGVMLREFADVTILESASELKEVGAAITPGPGALGILRRFGVHLEKEGGCVNDYVQIWGGNGKVFAKHPYNPSGAPEGNVISVHRADLHSALHREALSESRAGNPCTILLNHKVASLDAEAGIVHLLNGKTLQGDVVVAADGIRSNVRPFVVDEEVTPEVSGESAYRFLLRQEDLQAVNHPILEDGKIPPTMHIVVAPLRQIIAYPIRNYTLLNVVAFVPDSELHESVDDRWTSKGSAESLVKSFDHFSPLWKDLLAASKDVAVWQMRDLTPLKTWVKGRAILIGDAAHPMLPHQAAGAMSAIEDAEALALYLRGASSDAGSVHEALMWVFRVRLKRASECQALSRANNILHVRTGADMGDDVARMWRYSGAERWAAERPDMVLDA